VPFSPVYSAAFVQYTADTPNLSFLVPEGFTAVVRQVSAVQSAGAFNFGLYVQDSDAAPAVQVIAEVSSGFFNTFETEGRWVCPGGGTISCYVSTILDSLNVYVGGYLLRNVLT
jgi:hypothetical protein